MIPLATLDSSMMEIEIDPVCCLVDGTRDQWVMDIQQIECFTRTNYVVG